MEKKQKEQIAPVQQRGMNNQRKEPQQMSSKQMSPQQAAVLQILEKAKREKEKQMRQQEQIKENQEHDPEIQQEQSIQIIGEKEVKKAVEILQKYKECKTNLERRIVENEEWFKMQHWELMRKGKGETTEPASAWLFNTIINKHADLMDNYPEPLILPREAGDTEVAEMLSSIVPVVLEQNDYEQVFNDCGWYKLKTGTSVQGVFWDNSKMNGLGDVTIKKCDIINLFWESGITDIQDSSNVFYVTLVGNEELRQAYPNLKNLGNYPELDVNKYVYDDQVDVTDKTVVVDWYYKQKVHGYDPAGIPQTKTILHYCKFCNGQVLYASENDPKMRDTGFYEHGKYPFVVDVTFPEEGMLCGFGYIDVMKDCQAYIDKMQQAILSNALVNSRNRSVVNDGAGINEKEYADPSCTIIHASGHLGENDFRELQHVPLNGIYLSVLNNKIQEIKDTSGNTASSQGQASSVTSASGIASLQEAAGKLARDANKSTYRAHKKVVDLVIELIRQFYTEERCFRIKGEDGRQKFVQFSNTGMIPQSQGSDFGVELGQRLPIFDIDVRAAKKSAYSKESQNNMALNFYGQGFFAPANADAALACIEMMDFDGKEKVIEKISSNGLLYQQVMQLQQQVMQLSTLIDRSVGTNLAGVSAGGMKETDGMPKKGSVKTSNGSLTKQAASATRNSTSPR